MTRRRALPGLLALVLAASGCNAYYNAPGPDDLMHVIPWFDAMITQVNVHPYQRADIPRNTVAGTVPVGSTTADWEAEWSVANSATADKQVNPLAGQPASATGDTLFHTYCSPCHGNIGAGDGLVGRKMAAPSLLTDKARAYTDGSIYSIIRYGRGVMPRYGDKVRGTARWEIVNYVRQLQAAAAAPAAAPGGNN
ncbi:MAG TPA: cytochrome c [Gemmatimonadales bacterium]|nr:cytochrome c [Gemmatimonadales bacterium]